MHGSNCQCLFPLNPLGSLIRNVQYWVLHLDLTQSLESIGLTRAQSESYWESLLSVLLAMREKRGMLNLKDEYSVWKGRKEKIENPAWISVLGEMSSAQSREQCECLMGARLEPARWDKSPFLTARDAYLQ